MASLMLNLMESFECGSAHGSIDGLIDRISLGQEYCA